jgi:hypothetical protein
VSTSLHTSPSIGNRKITETFTLHRATRYGGFNVLSDFVREKGIDQALEEAFGQEKAPWAEYTWPETLRHLLDGYLLGLERIWHFEELEEEPMLCAKRGRRKLPDYTLLYRELARFDTQEKVGRLRWIGEKLIRQALAQQQGAVLDMDSTVETLYGHQQGAKVGPNPHKRGRPSYHPLVCRERQSGLVVNTRLRPGDTGCATDAVSFLIQSGARLPRWLRRKLLVCADRGFDCEAVYGCCEKRGWHYVIKLRVTADLALQIWHHALRGRWRTIESEDDTVVVEVAEILFQRQCWSRSRRVVISRRKDAQNPQGHLWDTLGYNYSAYVSDLEWAAEDICTLYDQRGEVEKTIYELKEDFSIGRVPTQFFLANWADLELKILAFNLLVLYQRQALGYCVLHRAKTLRRRVIALAGQLIRTGGRWVLKLAAAWRWQQELVHARKWLATASP